MISRRALLAGAASAAALAMTRRAFAGSGPMPCGFVGHGSPFLAVDPVRGAELRKWGAALPKPTGIVTLTPHYRSRGVRIGHVGKGHALRSFPAGLGARVPESEYASPDNAALAKTVADLLAPLEPTFDEARAGFDHTTWMPLMHMFPRADVPVVEIALPFMKDEELLALGKRLSLLRHEGTFILASGSATHNLASIGSPPAPWAEAFDAWLAKTIAARDVAALVDWRAQAPSAELAHPDDGGHYRVMLVALGAVARDRTFGAATFPVEGFEGGTQSKRCIELI